MITRAIQQSIQERMNSGKAIIIMGARQVGKTTLLHQLLDAQQQVLWLNGDEIDVRNLMENATSSRLRTYFGTSNTVVIDEAQRIPNIGLKLKLITDQIPEVQLIATGSSSFELANLVNEPLTGRKWEYKMFPLSFAELVGNSNLLEEKRLIPHRLIYGCYPEVVTHPGDEREILQSLADSYLYKDILQIDSIHKPDKIVKLLQALAFQAGSEISFNELGQLCGLDSKTVGKYVTMLEQAYIIFRLGSYSRNLRNELKHSQKIYFYDNGILNVLTGNFSLPESRNDIGSLWENYLMAERLKFNHYNHRYVKPYFWRTTARQEIDYIEDGDGQVTAFEFKWNPKRKASMPKTFASAYPNTEFKVINNDNLEEFLL